MAHKSVPIALPDNDILHDDEDCPYLDKITDYLKDLASNGPKGDKSPTTNGHPKGDKSPTTNYKRNLKRNRVPDFYWVATSSFVVNEVVFLVRRSFSINDLIDSFSVPIY